jgi:hypothetical protein
MRGPKAKLKAVRPRLGRRGRPDKTITRRGPRASLASFPSASFKAKTCARGTDRQCLRQEFDEGHNNGSINGWSWTAIEKSRCGSSTGDGLLAPCFHPCFPSPSFLMFMFRIRAHILPHMRICFSLFFFSFPLPPAGPTLSLVIHS